MNSVNPFAKSATKKVAFPVSMVSSSTISSVVLLLATFPALLAHRLIPISVSLAFSATTSTQPFLQVASQSVSSATQRNLVQLEKALTLLQFVFHALLLIVSTAMELLLPCVLVVSTDISNLGTDVLSVLIAVGNATVYRTVFPVFKVFFPHFLTRLKLSFIAYLANFPAILVA